MIPLINKAWSQSFERLKQNRKAISTTITATTCSSTTDTNTQQSSLNFEFGKAAECIKILINSTQLLERREEIRMEQTEGKLLAQKLQEAKQITSGILSKTGETNQLGADVFIAYKENVNKKVEDMR